MAIDRRIFAYKSDGTTIIDNSPNGDGRIDSVCTQCEFSLGARQGCLGGRLRLTGNFRTPPRLKAGDHVKIYNWPLLIYSGKVTGYAKRLESGGHEHELRGAYNIIGTSLMEQINLTDQSPESLVQTIYDSYLSSLNGVESLTKAVSGVTVNRMFYEKTEGALLLIEQLELLAGSGGGYWVSGIDPAGQLYFQPISTSSGDVQLTATVALDAIRAHEKQSKSNIANRVAVRGGRILDEGTISDSIRGLTAHWRFDHAASIAKWGASKRYRISTPLVFMKADQQLMADGYFNRYADRSRDFDGLKVNVTNANTIPFPWAGQFKFVDAAQGISEQVYAYRVDVDFNLTAALRIHVGTDPNESFSPSEEKAFFNGGDTAAGGDGVSGIGTHGFESEDYLSRFPYGNTEDGFERQPEWQVLDGNGQSTGDIPGADGDSGGGGGTGGTKVFTNTLPGGWCT